MTETANTYEGMFLLGPTATAEPQAALDLVRQMIERHEGQLLVLKKWDERKLAYEIKKQKRGTYVLAYFKAPGKAVTAIERDVNLSEEVLRVLVLRADHLNQKEMEAMEPQPIQPREERPDWDRPRRDRPERGDRDRPPRRDEPAEASAAFKE